MAINYPKNKETNESSLGLQPYLLWFVAVIAASLIVIPLLPGLISNLIYSFSGHAPKIYWYLSRSAGFVALTILWGSMALGLSITNKMARVWPGAPAAFAMHEYVSLLGLAFAMYHGLVLMGDHFVDFSLSRLLTPFSIEHKTIWVGLGQVGFYIWAISALSFYVRRWIGQKTWRLIHYVNFATYVMGWLHGTFSGTDSNLDWVRWYYWISGGSLLVLLAYRVRDSALKKNFSFPQFLRQSVLSLPQGLRSSMTRPKESIPAIRKQDALPGSSTDKAGTSSQTTNRNYIQEPDAEKLQPKPSEISAIENQSPRTADAPHSPEAKATASAFIEKYEMGSGKDKINVRIFKEPPTEPSALETQKDTNPKKADGDPLVLKLKEELTATPIQPSEPNESAEKVLLED